MIILILGSDGLIGKNFRIFADEMKPIGHQYFFATRSDADLTQYNQVNDLFNRVKPDIVLNLAAHVGGLYKNIREPVEFFMNNMLLNMNVMQVCKECGVSKLISILSTCIFPDSVEYPITEDFLHKGPPHPSNECYSYAKRMVDVLSRAYGTEYGCNFVTIIPGNLYGPWDNFNTEDGHVIPAIIHKCYLAHESGLPLIIKGSGSAYRQFTYVKDLVVVLVWCIENYSDPDPLIVSTEEEVKIESVITDICECLGYRGQIVWNLTEPEGQYRKTVSTRKLRGLLDPNQFPFTSVKEGLQHTVAWFRENYNIARI